MWFFFIWCRRQKQSMGWWLCSGGWVCLNVYIFRLWYALVYKQDESKCTLWLNIGILCMYSSSTFTEFKNTFFSLWRWKIICHPQRLNCRNVLFIALNSNSKVWMNSSGRFWNKEDEGSLGWVSLQEFYQLL